jgi:cytochrome P450
MAGPVDLIKSLARPLPVLVAAPLIGFPVGLSDRLRAWSDVIATGQDADAAQRAGLEFTACVEEIVAGWAGGTPDALLSQLVAAELSGQVSREELLSAVFQVLLAGDETTAGLIGNGVLELLRHPRQLALLRARPELIDSAVEEMLRYNGPVGHSRPLYALADVEIGDTLIPQGDVVVPVLLAANRDPAVFPDPDRFDITRAPNPHLGLGHGPHFCVGAALGRLQARTAIGTLVRRYPRLTLAIDPAGLDWAPGLFLHTIRQLPVLLG